MARTKDALSLPITIVFKTSNRSNAKVKMKTFKNRTIDQVLMDKLPGVPESAQILEIGVGESFIKKYVSKYKL